MSRIDGVKSVEANPVAQTAMIVFDDTKTNFEQIRAALQRERILVMGKPEYK